MVAVRSILGAAFLALAALKVVGRVQWADLSLPESVLWSVMAVEACLGLMLVGPAWKAGLHGVISFCCCALVTAPMLVLRGVQMHECGCLGRVEVGVWQRTGLLVVLLTIACLGILRAGPGVDGESE